MKMSVAVVALAAFALPAVAQAQEVHIPISTSMERVCEGERSTVFTLDRSGSVALNQPVSEAYTARVYLTQSGSGYELVQQNNSAAGPLEIRASLAADGTVTSAALSGSAVEVLGPGTDHEALAKLFARDVYERLLVGRTFRVGSDYYAPDQRDTIVGDMIEAMGLPFPIEGSIDVAYRGLRKDGDRQVHLFDGTMTVGGSGDIDGISLTIEAQSKASVSHDATSGLVTAVSLSSETEISVDGQPFRAFRMTETLSCGIQPRQG